MSERRLLVIHLCQWSPRRTPKEILGELYAWIREHERVVERGFDGR